MGFPAQTADGAEVYIVSKTLDGPGSEVELFTDQDGRKFVKGPQGLVQIETTEEAAEAIDQDVLNADGQVEAKTIEVEETEEEEVEQTFYPEPDETTAPGSTATAEELTALTTPEAEPTDEELEALTAPEADDAA